MHAPNDFPSTPELLPLAPATEMQAHFNAFLEAKQKGDAAVMNDHFTRFYECNKRWLIPVLSAHVRRTLSIERGHFFDPSLLEEAAHRTAIAAARYAESYRPSGGIRRWLFGIGKNKLLDLDRRESRHCRHLDRSGELDMEKIPDPSPDASSGPAAKDTEKAIRSTLRRLGRWVDTAIVDLLVAEHSYEDVAAILGMTQNNVAARVVRLRKILRKTCREVNGDEEMER